MKRIQHSRQSGGFSLLEAIVVTVILAVLIGVFLPALMRPRHPGQQISCVNNLKQIGLSFRQWSLDHDDKFPMQVSVTNGGTMELIGNGNVFVHFLVLSNELNTPKILFCPQESDPKRREAVVFDSTIRLIAFTNDQSVSYFVGIDANESYPQMFLSGDRNLEIDGVAAKPGIVTLRTANVIGWTRELHKRQGNVAFADGSVHGFSSSKLGSALRATGVATNRLAIP